MKMLFYWFHIRWFLFQKIGSISGLEIMVLYLMVCKEFGKFKEVSEHIVSNCGYMLLSFSVSIAQFGQEVYV